MLRKKKSEERHRAGGVETPKPVTELSGDLMEKLENFMALMILNGDNRKIFIRNDMLYKIRENIVEEYRREDLVMVRSKMFFRAKTAKEFDGKYYFLTKKSILVYEDLFGDPVQEIEVPNDGVFDFHMHDGRLFYLARRMNRFLGIDEGHEIVFDFQGGAYFWDGVDFYICSNKNLIRFDVIKKRGEDVLCGVNVKCIVARNGTIAYADNGNILHFLKRKASLSYHHHSKPVAGIIITSLESLLVVCRDKKLVRIETKRNERVLLASFDGDPVDFMQDGSDIYVLTPFCLLAYDSKAGCIKKQIFSLPSFEYCKPLCGFECTSEETPGREVFERNVKKTKVVVPYAFKNECSSDFSRSSIVAVMRSYVFIYDLEKEEVQKIAYLGGSDCFYSSGFIVRLSSGGRGRRTAAKIYRIERDGLLFIRKYDSVGISSTPEDVVFDKGRLFLYSDGSFIEVTGPGITKRLGSESVRQIEETDVGAFLLDTRGIFKIGSGEWILEDEDITSLKVFEKTLFVSLFGSGIFGFEMKDGAAEEKLIDDANVTEVFVDGETIVTSSLWEGVSVLRRYKKNDNIWKKDGEALADKGIGRILHKNTYLSITNKLHRVEFGRRECLL
uniref:Uncharacterized protein n=1 Tax=Encephalitozoon cuniculi TaxID=6035 RepID=M1K8D7_ENCCN|nr:hypothetical protein ECU02_0120 [Encephalitozoon cuniculi]